VQTYETWDLWKKSFFFLSSKPRQRGVDVKVNRKEVQGGEKLAVLGEKTKHAGS